MLFTPSTKVLYADQYLSIRLLTNSYRAAVEVDWLNHCSGEELRRLSAQAAQLAQRHYVTSWIANDRALGELTHGDLCWAEQMLNHMHCDLGLDRFAMIVSDLPANQQLLQPLLDKYSGPRSHISLRLFTEPNQARLWALSL
ncbi:hypothetical protein [Hymenobacter sp. CRA2]|uniref:hypothetical protein n=1 Tax=Hymenobacter sp. CRA2 TaxID=1955620 RepID=UPI00098FF01F|nr:hypothetical protein [Hymenobacter sp. CRA2]OON66244.1 hypothetical protein B0919_22425 [Hymenobacter sp. CRA2]